MANPTITLQRRSRWLVWRDIVLVLLAVALVQLINQVGDLRSQLDQTTAQRARDQAATVQAINTLQGQLAVKDARIKQLTDQLIRAHIKPIPAPSVEPEPQPGPSPTATGTPPPTPSPRPSPSSSRRPHPQPSPSMTCAAVVDQVCLNP